MEIPTPVVRQDRVIRVFISSTFRDMQAERELLIKRIFPELRSICANRFVTFTEVDLRWGITEEQAAEGKVLPICLEEIERSRPYFIGLLGERYGWIPAAFPPEVIEQEPWLTEHVSGRTSVTEMEILHGVLRNPAMAKHAFFYFRDPAYVNTLPEAERRELVEQPIPEDIRIFGEAEAVRRTEERRAKLAMLKDRIRQSGLPVFDNYANPEALGDAVRRQFIALIDELYPMPKVPDALTREAQGHESYARSKLLAYVERPAHTAVLDAFISGESTGQGLALTGESGSGKTALLADWMQKRRQSGAAALAFEHYFGATPESATVSAFLVRLIGELKRSFGITEDIPSDPARLREALPLWLAQASGRGRIVLVLDGLNQIEGEEADRRLMWLPRFFPRDVRVIASTLTGPALDVLRERGWQEHELLPADAAEREAMIERFLKHYRKTLRADLSQQIANASGARNPLFLRTVLEELRQFGSFERLPAEVARYPEASTPGELFRLVIQRWRRDFDGGSAFVRRALRHLWAARQGLAETEWLELLSAEKPIPRQEWVPLFLAIEPHLSQQAGLYTFGHEFLRHAVRAECFGDEDDVRAAHHELAGYFERQAIAPRSSAELPWQLREAGERDRLRTCLLDIDRFLLIRNRGENELLRYWIWLGQERLMGKEYLEVFEAWSRVKGRDDHLIAYTANQLATFMHYASLYVEAEPLVRRALAINEQSPAKDPLRIAALLNNLAQLLQATNRLADAEPLIRRALAIDEQSYGKHHPKIARDLNNLALLLQAANRLSEAEPLMRRALAIDEQSYGKHHPNVAESLNNLAHLLQAANRLSEAEPLMRRALAIDEQSFGNDHPIVAIDLKNLAHLLQETNRLAEAEPLMRRALAISEQSYGTNHPKVAIRLINLAQLLHTTNRLAEAEPLVRRALAIDEQCYGKNHPDVALALNNLAQLLQETNRPAEAEPLMRRALAIDEQSFGKNHPKVAIRLNNLAQLLHDTNRPAEAEPLMRRALAIDRQSFGEDHPSVARDLSNLAGLLQETNRAAEAEPLMRRALVIDERSYGKDHPNVAIRLINLAELLRDGNRLAEAEPLMRRAIVICEQSYGQSHPMVAGALNNLAALLQATNRPAEAEPLMRRALAIGEESCGKNHPDVAIQLNNLAQLLQAANRPAEAELLMRRALAIDEQYCGTDRSDAATRLNNLAQLLKATNRPAEAEPLMRRAIDILLKLTRKTGHAHPHLQAVMKNYADLLRAMGRGPDEIQNTLRSLAPEMFPLTVAELNSLLEKAEHSGRYEEAVKLGRQLVESTERALGCDHPQFAIALNRLALLLRRTGALTQAEAILRRALRIEEKYLGPEHSKIPHRLNNLSTILMMQGKWTEARETCGRAWLLKSGRRDVVSARILFVRLAIAWLSSEPGDLFVGQMKTLLSDSSLPPADGIARSADYDHIVWFISRKLTVAQTEFLIALSDALNDPGEVGKLHRFSIWKDQIPVPIETPWPEPT
ncbi:MAG: tetratricopeptide repeat protein [Acidobacteria bacterium]|nr:tetratricopeptide repeat protein [Acidobacteriota bacterium]